MAKVNVPNQQGTSSEAFEVGYPVGQVFDTSLLTAKRTWVLPDNDGSPGYVLSTDGASNLDWAAPGAATAAGSNTEIQFNSSGVFGADSGFTFNTSGGKNLEIGGGPTSTVDDGRIRIFSSTSSNVNELILQATSSDSSLSFVGGDGFLRINGTTGRLHVGRGSYTPLLIDLAAGGDIIFKDASGNENFWIFGATGAWGVGAGSSAGTAGQVITSQGSSLPPKWDTPTGGGGSGSAPFYEEAVATASQTVFNTTMATTASAADKAYLTIYVNGIQMMEGATRAFTVTGANQITFNFGLALNDDVAFYGYPLASPPGYEEQVATSGQTVVNTTVPTVASSGGIAHLQVFVNGALAMEGATKKFTVTGANQLTFNAGLRLNDDLAIFSF